MTIPALIAMAILLSSFAWRKEDLIYLLLGSVAFGSLAVIPPQWVGGADLLPVSLAGVILSSRSLADARTRKAMFEAAFDLKKLGLYSVFIAIAIVSAFLFPRLFAGQMYVAAMRGDSGLLGPTSTNFTQLAYLLVSYAVALSMSADAGEANFVNKFFKATVIGAAVLFLSGLLDWGLGSKGDAVLSLFKTAQYAILEDNEAGGLRRVTGFMSEASAFGSACVALGMGAILSAQLFFTSSMRWTAYAVGGATLAMGFLSTSSTALSGLGLAGIIYLAYFAWRCIRLVVFGEFSAAKRFVAGELGMLALIASGLIIVAIVDPAAFDFPRRLIDELVFRKYTGSSFHDRGAWNTLALDALAQTRGVGVGVGSARTSSWLVSVLSNTGVAGGVFLFSFIFLSVLPSARKTLPFYREAMWVCRGSLFVSLFMASLSATSPDMGLFASAILGVLSGLRTGSHADQSISIDDDTTIQAAPGPLLQAS